jgi:hypothetical protein
MVKDLQPPKQAFDLYLTRMNTRRRMWIKKYMCKYRCDGVNKRNNNEEKGNWIR